MSEKNGQKKKAVIAGIALLATVNGNKLVAKSPKKGDYKPVVCHSEQMLKPFSIDQQELNYACDDALKLYADMLNSRLNDLDAKSLSANKKLEQDHDIQDELLNYTNRLYKNTNNLSRLYKNKETNLNTALGMTTEQVSQDIIDKGINNVNIATIRSNGYHDIYTFLDVINKFLTQADIKEIDTRYVDCYKNLTEKDKKGKCHIRDNAKTVITWQEALTKIGQNANYEHSMTSMIPGYIYENKIRSKIFNCIMEIQKALANKKDKKAIIKLVDKNVKEAASILPDSYGTFEERKAVVSEFFSFYIIGYLFEHINDLGLRVDMIKPDIIVEPLHDKIVKVDTAEIIR